MIPDYDRALPAPYPSRLAPVRDRLQGLLVRAEVDRAVFFALIARVWQLLAGPITLLVIATYFTPELQGFYYTFASLLALQSFVELGFYLVIINVASHEWARLRMDKAGSIVGDPSALSRLVSLGQLIFKWYAIASTVFIAGVGGAGYVFFSQSPHSDIEWHYPWLSLVLLTGVALWSLPFVSLLEGCNQVASVNQFRFRFGILDTSALWITAVLGLGLWAAVISGGVRLCRDLYLLLVKYRSFFKPFFKPPLNGSVEWRTEIWPMQWRLALSGVASYFAFSLFNPIMFHYHGPAIAGQMGMTWQVVQGIQAIALAWVYANVPRFGTMIANKAYAELDRSWKRISVITLTVGITASVGTWLLVYVANVIGISLAQRLLGPLPTGLLLLAIIPMLISQCQSAYLRAHKCEPLMEMSIIAGLLIALTIWGLGSKLGPIGAAVGYLAVITLFVVPYETYIWLRCRTMWHQ